MIKSIVVLLSLLLVVAVSTADDRKTYHVYHKLGNNDDIMQPRGTIQIAPDEDSVLVATFHSDKSAQLDTTAFDNMVENNGLYTVIVLEEGHTKPSKSNTQKYVSASVPGCSLRRANLREEISLSISPTGKLLSVSYRPLISPLAPKSCQQLPPLADKPSAIFSRDTNEESMPFKTTVSFDSHNPMMAIPTILPNSRPPPGKSALVLFYHMISCVQ